MYPPTTSATNFVQRVDNRGIDVTAGMNCQVSPHYRNSPNPDYHTQRTLYGVQAPEMSADTALSSHMRSGTGEAAWNV